MSLTKQNPDVVNCTAGELDFPSAGGVGGGVVGWWGGGVVGWGGQPVKQKPIYPRNLEANR